MDKQAHVQHSHQLHPTQQQPLEQQEAPAVSQLAQAVDQLAFATPRIVYLILKEASAVDMGPYEVPVSFVDDHQRLKMLSNAALVCSAWREPAQALMWEHVELNSTKAAESFSLSADKHRRTVSLRIGVRQKLDGKLAEQIVTSCRELEKLELHAIQDLDSSAFSSRDLSKLKHLYINCTVSFQPLDDAGHRVMELPFLLDYLHLVMHEASGDGQPLFATIPNTLHTLRLADRTPEPSAFDTAPEPAEFDVDVFIPLMQQSRALKSLELPAAGLRLLYSLSSAVENLCIVLAPSESQTPLLDWVEWAEATAPEIISRLKVLEIETFSEAEEWQEAEMVLLGYGINVSLFEL